MSETIKYWLLILGLSENIAILIKNFILLAIIVFAGFIAYYISKVIILRAFREIAKKTLTKWDDALIERKVFNRLIHFIPAIIIYLSVLLVLKEYPLWTKIVQSLMKIYMVFIMIFSASAFLNAVYDISQDYETSARRPIKAYIQVGKIIIYIIGGILIISILLNKSPLILLGSLGAISAVLLLIFKDAITGFVASIQLSANDIVKVGDCVYIPQYGIDGEVIEITLTTVKIQNRDKMLSFIPVSTLVSETFQNYRGIEQSDGRRIKRHVNIDIHSIKFCTEEIFQRLEKNSLLSDFIRNKRDEFVKFINEKNLTNLKIFREYLAYYLKNNPNINQQMTFLIHELQSSDKGLPLEIYVFSKIKDWEDYEKIQADIFDHIFAIIPEFDLRIFQSLLDINSHS